MARSMLIIFCELTRPDQVLDCKKITTKKKRTFSSQSTNLFGFASQGGRAQSTHASYAGQQAFGIDHGLPGVRSECIYDGSGGTFFHAFRSQYFLNHTVVPFTSVIGLMLPSFWVVCNSIKGPSFGWKAAVDKKCKLASAIQHRTKNVPAFGSWADVPIPQILHVSFNATTVRYAIL